MDKPGLLAAATGVYDGWPGATLMRSDDSGQSYKSVDGFVAPGCVIAYAPSAIGAGVTHIVDASSLLNVRTLYGTLASVTELQMYNGANHFAYGVDGRWEIIAAKTVTEESDGSYTLQNLMRGRFGTEQYAGTHAAHDAVILLDQSMLRFAAMDVASINIERLWRAVTRGAILDSAADTAFTYAGINLECLSPVYIGGSKSPSGDWTIGWTRRTRTPVEPFSGVAAPLAESSESYDVEIYSDSTYGTLKRTLTGLTSASATYTSAQQTTDFGAVQKFLYVKVYQLSATVGRGYPAAAVVGPTHLINLKSLIHFDEGGYEYLPYRKLAIHCDGANGSTTFTDIHGKTVTANGNAQISTAQYPALTGKTSSAYFDGNGDYLSIPDSADWHLGSGDFTIRARIRPVGYASNNGGEYRSCIVSQDVSTGRSFAFNIVGTASSFTTLGFIGCSDNSSGYTIVTASFTFSLNTWYLVEACRVGNLVYLFVDGTLLNTGGTSFTRTIQDVSTTLKIGAELFDATYLYYFNGYISEIELINGFGEHTSSYTPSPIPFADSALAITDKVGNAVTVTGTAAVVSNASSFGGYCLQANQASGYVSIPVIDLTADRWTIDLWITPDAMPSSGNQSGVFRYGTGDSGLGGLSVVIRSTGSARCYFGALVSPIETSVAPFAAGVRSHLFIMRDGPRFYIGAAGTVGENKLVSDTAFVGNKGFDIGYALAASLDPKAIKIDEWRVFSGEASYPTSGTYTIPAIAFPDP